MKLYPPYIEGTIPAFYEDDEGTATIVVPFSMNRAVNSRDVYGFHMKVKTVQSNSYVLDLEVTKDTVPDKGFYNFDNSSTVSFKIKEQEFYSETLKGRITSAAYHNYVNNYDKTTTRLGYYNSNSNFVTVTSANTYNASRNYVERKRRFNVGQFYKVQLAYIDENGDEGYYSTTAVVKFTTKPDVTIEGLKLGAVNLHRRTYIGHYSQATIENEKYRDTTEKEYSYQFLLTDNEGNVLKDTGILLHNNSNDLNNYESFDSFTLPLELTEGTSYYLQYKITTNNGLTMESSNYRIMYAKSVEPEIQAKVISELNYNNGYILIKLEGEKDNGIERNVTGSFLISRSDDKSNFTIWDEILKFNLVGQTPSYWSWKDMTVEHGVKYRYALQQYNKNELYSEKILSVYYDENGDEINAPIEAYFEDSFLFDGKIQLKIKYNPKVSSFKTTLMETKVDTIGSKYPFVFRNSAVEYKEFPISGLISYLSDEENLFVSDEDIDLTKNFTNWTRQTTISSDIDEDDFFFDIQNYSESNKTYEESEAMRAGYELQQQQMKLIEEAKQRTTDLLDYNVAAERAFKLKVLDWLNNGEIKLFRSPAEGNYIVRLMNVSLSPEDRLGRMLHTFNCNAYEIAECTYDNLASYNLLTTVLNGDRVYKTETVQLIKDNNDDNDPRYQQDSFGRYVIKGEVLPAHKEVVGVRFENIPYDYIVGNNSPEFNMIIDGERFLIKGDSPSYPIDMGLSFESVKISDSLHNFLTQASALNSDPLVTIEYYEISDSLFNTVTNIILDTIPVSTWIGSTLHVNKRYLNDEDVLDVIKDGGKILKYENHLEDELNYHQITSYESDNLLDALNSEKQNVVRFLYANFFLRDIEDVIENGNADSLNDYIWKYNGGNYISNDNDDKIYLYPTKVSDKTYGENGYGLNQDLKLRKDVLYKFVLPSGTALNGILKKSNGTTNLPAFGHSISLYVDLTHPDVLYYDPYIFENNRSQYQINKKRTKLPDYVINKIKEFNNSGEAYLKLEPYDPTFSINGKENINLGQDEDENYLIPYRFRSKPFISTYIRLGNGVTMNYCVETQTLSYYIEDTNEGLQGATTKDNDAYKLYNLCLDTIDNYRSIDLGSYTTSTQRERACRTAVQAIQNDINEIYSESSLLLYNFRQDILAAISAADAENVAEHYELELAYVLQEFYNQLSRLYIIRTKDSNGKCYTDIETLKDKAYFQIDRELAQWKEEQLY